MEAVEFLKEKNRMTDNCKIECDNCPLSSENNWQGRLCENFIKSAPEDAVKIVEEWSKQNPKKTRLTEFLKLFPNAKLYNGYPNGCIGEYERIYECNEFSICSECCEKFWNEEIKDDE